MIYRSFFLLTFLFFIGCSQAENVGRNDENLIQVIINSDSGQTVYYLKQDTKLVRSEHIDTDGVVTEHFYNYNSNGELQYISKKISNGDASEFYIEREYNRNNGEISKRIITQSNARGKNLRYECTYEYDESIGLYKKTQIDDDGNIQEIIIK